MRSVFCVTGWGWFSSLVEGRVGLERLVCEKFVCLSRFVFRGDSYCFPRDPNTS